MLAVLVSVRQLPNMDLQASLGRGPLCSRALRFANDFFDLDVFLVEEADVSFESPKTFASF